MRPTFLLVLLCILVPAGDARAQGAEYARADSIALAAPPEAEESLAALADYLTRDLATEREKARAIYRWVTEKVAFDANAFFRGAMFIPTQDARTVLRRRTAVCEGFALLYASLARYAGMEAEYVSGRAKGFGVKPGQVGENHGWNAVRIDGEWQLVDATWGAGDLENRRFVRRVRDFYFLTPPEQLIFSHLPDDAKWQLLARPVPRREFARQVILPRDFFELGFSPDQIHRAAAEPGFRGVVDAFPPAEREVQVVEAPVGRSLSPGAAYRFRLRAPGATGAFAIEGGRWHPLASHAEEFSAEVVPAATELVVVVRYPEAPEGRVVLRYPPDPVIRAHGRR